jgi:hypothetical protein
LSCSVYRRSETNAAPERLTFDSNGTMFLPDSRVFQAGGWNWGHWDLVQPEDASNNKQEGANIVRMVLRWWGYYAIETNDAYADAEPGHLNTTNIEILDQRIAWAVAQGLWINLAFDSNCGQNGNQSTQMSAYCTIDGAPAQNFWNNLSMRQKFKDAWAFLANRYKNTNRIAWYEILPEPSPPGYGDVPVRQFYGELISVIRAVDAVTPILVGPNNAYAVNKLPNAYNATWSNIVYTSNFLDPIMRNLTTMPPKVDIVTAFRNTYGVPVFIQQAGTRTETDQDASKLSGGLQMLINANIGYTVWEYRGNSIAEYSAWWQNDTGRGFNWSLKQQMLDVMMAKFALWSTPLDPPAAPALPPTSSGSAPSASNPPPAARAPQTTIPLAKGPTAAPKAATAPSGSSVNGSASAFSASPAIFITLIVYFCAMLL